MISINTLIGTKIRELRKQKGLSQEETAEHLHISQSTLARIEKGERNSWVSYLQPICAFFDIAPDELLKQDSYTFNQNNRKGDNNGLVINQLSEKLIEQYEARIEEKNLRIKEKDALIARLMQKLEDKRE